MAWTSPRTWVVGEFVTAALMNTHVRDNFNYLLTKHMWFDCSYAFTGGADNWPTGGLGGLCTDLNDYASVQFRIPDDFVSLSQAVLAMIALATDAALNWDTSSQYAKTGEAFNTHTEADAATTYNGTANQNLDIDVSGILSGIAPLDTGYVKILLADANDDFRCYGLYIEYLSGA